MPACALESQQLQRLDPKRHAALVRAGYVRELGQPDPAVVMFTTAIAARAIMEFMQLMTGFMGDDRTATEVLERFHESEVRTNSRPGQAECYCMSPAQWGRGDEKRFLGLTRRTRPVPKRGGSW
jgi:hypothetical protein